MAVAIPDDPAPIPALLADLKAAFRTGATKSLDFRKQALQNMARGLDQLKQDFNEALKQDMGHTAFGSELFSLFITKKEVQNNLDNLERWSKPVSYDTPVAIGPGSSYLLPEPLGVVLVLSAWNYPVYTAVGAMAPAVAAGNCVVLKPSELAPASSKVLVKYFEKYLDSRYFRIIEGQVQVAKSIVSQKFDLIIFTGSPQKGRLVAKAAADNLVPCILELGGKSPTIVDEDADLEVSAQRIAQGRFSNCGQTCVAPDYVLVHKSVKAQLLKALLDSIRKFYPNGDDMGQIITKDHTLRLKSYLDEDHRGKVLIGGRVDVDKKFIEPTVVDQPRLDSLLMREQIFGPILPVIEFSDIKEVASFVNDREKPLALYYFGSKNKQFLIENTSSGAVLVNDTIFHVIHTELPFGGVGNSGYGAYHGKFGFDGCSHMKPVLQKGTLNLYPLTARYPPYDQSKQSLMMFLMKNSFIGQSKLLKGLAAVIVAGGLFGLAYSGKLRQITDLLRSELAKL